MWGGAEGQGGTWKELEGEEREGGEEAASLQRLFIDKVAAEDCSWVDARSRANVLSCTHFLAVCLQADAELSHLRGPRRVQDNVNSLRFRDVDIIQWRDSCDQETGGFRGRKETDQEVR